MSGVCEGCRGLYYSKDRNRSLLQRDPLTPFVRTGNPDSDRTALLRDHSSSCPFCRDLWGAVEAFAQGREVSERFGFELWTWRTGETTLYLQYKAGGEDVKIEFYAEPAQGGRDLGYWSVKRRVVADTGSDEAFALVKSWIDNCVDSHPDCRIISDTENASHLPTRVLDVGSPGDTSKLKLFVTNGAQAPYIALSHCWGKLPLLNTTKATLNERTQVIPMHSLPQAFQDAVTITRKLGLQYLWIDSLCIIQDDEADWDAEAAQMANVYGGAFLTIANAWSDTSTKPILRAYPKKDPETLDPFVTRMLKAKVRRAIDHEGDPNPLSTRAWTLQERVLSRRILHYDSDEMRFECREGAKCECSSFQMPIRGGISHYTGPMTFAPWADDVDDRLRLWFDLVEEYSNRNLTVGADKIPAFYGMAQRFQSRDFGFGSFTVGFWEDAQLVCLLWTTEYQIHRHAEFPTGQKHRPSTYRAPTWSWAAIDGQTWYPDEVLHTMKTAYRRCSIYDCLTASSGRAGKVVSALMEVRSYVVNVTVELPALGEEKRKSHQQHWRIISGEIKCWFTPDAPLYDIDAIEEIQKEEPVKVVETQEAPKTTKKKSGLRKLFSRDKAKDKDRNSQLPNLAEIQVARKEKAHIKCLLLAHGSNSYEHRSPETAAVTRSIGNEYRGIGLVLKPSKTSPGAFERVGLVILYRFAEGLFNDAPEELLTLV